MGSVEVIPSISSSTIALLTGIYTDLLQTIHAFDKEAWSLFKTRKWKLLWLHLRGHFLLPVGVGIILSLLTTVRLISYLLVRYPIEVWSFFCGLSLVAVVSIYRKITTHTWRTICYSLLGLLASSLIIATDVIITSHTPEVIFLSGILAACAMILPGISGSFLLLILGQYTYLLHALQDLAWGVLSLFAAGAVIGLFLASKLVLQLFRNHADTMMALVAGFMTGSLYHIWPWRHASSAFSKDVAVAYASRTTNILPHQFQWIYQQDPRIWQAILCCAFGCTSVMLLTQWGLKKQHHL